MPEKKLYDLTVDPEFRDLIPPLNEEELKLLEESLVADGCESPLIVWNGVIIDGHNRYAICRKHDIPFSIQEKNFDTREEVMLWMLRNQLGRRNLNNYQRSELALKFEPLFAHASEKRMLAGKLVDPPQNSAEGSGETRKQIAKMAGVSHDTIKKVKRLHEHADEETKSRLRRGEMTVNKAYNELMQKEHEGETKICDRCRKEKSITAFAVPSNRHGFSSVCRECEKEISAASKSAAEAVASNPAEPCPIPGGHCCKLRTALSHSRHGDAQRRADPCGKAAARYSRDVPVCGRPGEELLRFLCDRPDLGHAPLFGWHG